MEREDEVGKLELKRWVLRCFLKDATEGLFLILKGKEFKKNLSLRLLRLVFLEELYR